MVDYLLNIIMNKKLFQLAGFVVLAATMVGAASAFLAEDVNAVPRYGDDCAHGHNGFDCKTAQHLLDIDDLQERMTAIEKRIVTLEMIR